jgi:hypothetical protein
MACAGVADVDGGAGARFEDRRPGITETAMAGRLARRFAVSAPSLSPSRATLLGVTQTPPGALADSCRYSGSISSTPAATYTHRRGVRRLPSSQGPRELRLLLTHDRQHLFERRG